MVSADLPTGSITTGTIFPLFFCPNAVSKEQKQNINMNNLFFMDLSNYRLY